MSCWKSGKWNKAVLHHCQAVCLSLVEIFMNLITSIFPMRRISNVIPMRRITIDQTRNIRKEMSKNTRSSFSQMVDVVASQIEKQIQSDIVVFKEIQKEHDLHQKRYLGRIGERTFLEEWRPWWSNIIFKSANKLLYLYKNYAACIIYVNFF